MKFPESWLREHVIVAASRDELAATLTAIGLEVEGIEPVGAALDGVVVAQILSTERHPQADRLQVCQVAFGEGDPVQIVCGAPNARAGLKAPLAKVGATLPGGMAIGAAKLRGVDSFGMLCSARELQLSDEHGGLLELAADAPIGADIRQVLNLDDHLFTLKLTPNLAHGLSVFGIAREVSALTGAPLKTPACPPVKVMHDAGCLCASKLPTCAGASRAGSSAA